jgi:hypothetical protein
MYPKNPANPNVVKIAFGTNPMYGILIKRADIATTASTMTRAISRIGGVAGETIRTGFDATFFRGILSMVDIDLATISDISLRSSQRF